MLENEKIRDTGNTLLRSAPLLFLAARLTFTLVFGELNSKTLLRVGNPFQRGQRNVK